MSSKRPHSPADTDGDDPDPSVKRQSRRASAPESVHTPGATSHSIAPSSSSSSSSSTAATSASRKRAGASALDAAPDVDDLLSAAATHSPNNNSQSSIPVHVANEVALPPIYYALQFPLVWLRCGGAAVRAAMMTRDL